MRPRPSPFVSCLLAVALFVTGCEVASAPDAAGRSRAAARIFLARYVDDDGRVVRRDQGGDTVSEGVSYALLLAQVAGDVEAEREVWAWAQEHLRRPDGLLSFRTDTDGRVVDREAATDADLVVAWALSRSSDPGLVEDSVALVSSIRAKTTVRPPSGPLLAAGPWATGAPATLNPSYWVFPALRALRMGDLLAPASAAMRTLTSPADVLPPDWARLDGDRLTPTPDPGGRFPDVRYGLDAQRATVWLAVDCDARNRALATEHRRLLQDRPAAVARDQRGAVLDGTRHPLGLVAAAAAAHADGDGASRDRLLDDAADLDQEQPTYYGSAWVALGRALLQTDELSACEEGR